MKTCVSTYSFRRYNDKDMLGVPGVIEKAAEMGFEGIEFTESEMTTAENAGKLREKCLEKEITPVAFCVAADFAKEDKCLLRDEIKRVQALVDIAELLGVKMIRHDVAYGYFQRKYRIGYEDMIPCMAEGILEVTKYAEQKGIKTMTENHGFYSQDSVRVEKLINAVAHPNFGALVDIGNFMCADENPNISVGRMAPYAFHVHCKDFYFKSGREINPGEGWLCTRGGNYLRGAVLGFGDAGAAQSLGILARAGYDGYASVEFEGGEDELWGISACLKNLKRFIAMAEEKK